MAEHPFIITIDQGTTSSRALAFDLDGRMAFVSQQEFAQHYPEPGWVEHDPEEIWQSVADALRDCADQVAAAGGRVAGIGVTNQRETTVLWDRRDGKPIHRAIVWQDRRTADVCRKLRDDGAEEEVSRRTGLLLDPYFSATKTAWLLDHVDGARHLADEGHLAFGTIDCFLMWRLTGGRVHATDATNASRTSLFNIHTLEWDPELLRLFGVPQSVLPDVRDCIAEFGQVDEHVLSGGVVIGGCAGDQQAASIGQACLRPGDIKSTYGTGCFVMVNTGAEPVVSGHRLLTTLAWQHDGKPTYALEGSIFIAGAVVQWLRDALKIIPDAASSESLAASLASNKGVYMVPAFTGLGAPHWDPDARGALFGLTRDSGRAEFVRAALESVCYQTSDLLTAIKSDGVEPSHIKVDGAMSANNWMMQFLADMLDLIVERPVITETTALGAACLAGAQRGVYPPLTELAERWQLDRRFEPDMSPDLRGELLEGWNRAISRVT